MTTLQSPRGTHDVLPDEFPRFARVIDVARETARLYGYREMATPVFEATELFARTSGETSDVVSKEMYSFADRGGEPLTLRPEYTAGICRAFLAHGQQQNVPFKVFAHGPMFRYSRPQKGRYRQFHQIDVESIGVGEPQVDVEVVALAADILDRLGVLKDCTLEINSLGDAESRAAHRKVLIDYFKAHFHELSEDSRGRLEKNPLRIFDSKEESDRKLLPNAPLLTDYLTPAAKAYFRSVLDGLNALGIAGTVSPTLVRGLDYYTHTAFEFTTDKLGAQSAVLGGGRYDGLIAELGGQPTPGIGWAAGIERLMLLAGDPPPGPRPVALVPLGAAAEAKAPVVARDLRRLGIAVELDYKGNMKKRLARANKIGARAAVILGDNELAKGVAALKDMDSQAQREVPLADLAAALKALG